MLRGMDEIDDLTRDFADRTVVTTINATNVEVVKTVVWWSQKRPGAN